MKADIKLSEENKNILLKLARHSIGSRFSGSRIVYPEFNSELNQKCGVFVSLHIGENLRGCIGYIRSDINLIKIVSDAAISAAFSDYRFSPLSEQEFDKVSIEISVLSPFIKIAEIGDIIPGTHGLYISYESRSGLLLPQVASKYSWETVIFLEQTCKKAGLHPDTWKRKNCSIEIFSAIIFSENNV